MDSTGDHPATEQKYHADANFALPGPGDLPRAPAATVPGDELLASREEWPAAAGTEPALGASRLAADPGSPAMSNPGPAAPLMRLRERMLAHVIETSGIRDERIAAALRDVPRHLFLPHLPPEDAYLDDAIVTKRDADGQPISSSSQPAIMAIMLDQLTLAPGQRVLEIGAGTGYNAALMRHLVGPRAPW